MIPEEFVRWYTTERRKELEDKAYPGANRRCGAQMTHVQDGLAIVATNMLRSLHILERIMGDPPRVCRNDGRTGQVLESYLVGATKHEACRLAKRESKARVKGRFVDGRGYHLSVEVSPSARIEQLDLRAAISQCWTRLDDDEQQVLRTVYCENAPIQSVPERTWRRWVYNARAKLYSCFQQNSLADYDLTMIWETVITVACSSLMMSEDEYFEDKT